jgi:hypothetical protein
MSAGLRIERQVHFRRRGRGFRKELEAGLEPIAPVTSGRVPRVARLMALAIRCEQLIREGVLRDYAEIAELGHVSRARVSQVMNLLQLAPGIQEEVLFLPRTNRGRDVCHLQQLQSIAASLDWRKQRRMWAELFIDRPINT